MRRRLQILVAESEERRFLRDRIYARRRIRHAASEQECLDLAYAGAGDILLLDLGDAAFGDPDLIRRLRFISRNELPLVGVAPPRLRGPERWLRAGLDDLLPREGLTPFLLDRFLRHWVRYHRMRVRLADAQRRALHWWKDLTQVLDELRVSLDRNADSIDAYLTLIESEESELPNHRQRAVANARGPLAELRHLAQELDVAARTIQLEGIERTREQGREGGRGLFSAEAMIEEAVEEDRNRSIDPSISRDPGLRRRYGT